MQRVICHLPSWNVSLLLLMLLAGSAHAQVGTLRLATGLSNPTYLTAPTDDFARLFVTERQGDIEILEASTGAVSGLPFLSIANVETLASIAFHPNYASNGFFYVFYHDTADEVRVVRYEEMMGNPNLADPLSAVPVLSLTNAGHFGGWMGFGPDGYLYVQIGDGGDFMSHDAPGNGQGITTELNGNILRIDVDGDDFPADPLRNYAIPSTNPFVGIVGLDEIWAYGLRNPWRGSFDRLTGDYYFADVGQDTREEIDVEEAGSLGGRNYGWRLREGLIATPTGGVGGPQPPGGVDPVYDYMNGTGPSEGESVTGGYVYRGPIHELRGLYFFGDFSNSRIWSLEVDPVAQTASGFLDWTSDFTPDVGSIDSLVSFGEDARGHLYIVDFDGEIFRVTGPVPVPFLPPMAGVMIGIGLIMTGSLSLKRRGR